MYRPVFSVLKFLLLGLTLGAGLAACGESSNGESSNRESSNELHDTIQQDTTLQDNSGVQQDDFERQGLKAKIKRVIDGDTVEVDFYDEDIKNTSVRLIGINTPEVSSPHTREQCFGPEASSRLKYLVEQEADVYVVRDIDAYDIYGRFLAYIFRASDGKFINELMVEEGFARILEIAPNTFYSRRLKTAETRAISQNLGLWEICKDR